MAVPLLPLLLAALCVAASGLALARLVPGLRRGGLLPRLGWAWLLGCAWLGGAAYAASHVLHLPLRRGVLLPIVLLPVAAAFFGHARERRERGSLPARRNAPLPFDPFERGLVVLLVSFGLFVTTSLVAHGLAVAVSDWDGKMTWVAQARYIRGARSVDAPVLRDPAAWVTHPRYPVLMPVLQVAAQELADAPWDDDRFVRGLYAFFWPACLLVLHDAASRRAGRLAAGAAALAAAMAPVLAFTQHGGAAGTYSDLPLACFWGGGLLLLTVEGAGLPEGFAAGLLLGAAVLTKNEGLALAAIALAAGAAGAVFTARRRTVLVALAAAAASVAAAAFLLASWRSGIPARYDEGQVQSFAVGALARGALSRLPAAARDCARLMSDPAEWGFTWVAVPLGLLLGARRLRRLEALPLAVAVAGALALYASAYALSSWPIHVLTGTTWDRLLVQMALPVFVLLALALDARPASDQRIAASSYR